MNTIADIVNDILFKLDKTEFEWLKSHTIDEARAAHHSFGMWIRNTYSLWHTSPITERWRTDPSSHDVRDGIDYSEDHPDTVSDTVIQELWSRVNASTL